MTHAAIPTFDQDQATAARSDPRRPLLVLAGPGSGKTAALVARVAHIHSVRCNPASASGAITALTFTRNAARELADRLPDHLGADVDRAAIDVRTFHSFGLRLLREGWAAEYLGWGRVRVATAGQMAQASTHALARASIALPSDKALAMIGAEKRGDSEELGTPQRRDVAGLRSAYDAWLHERGLIDVDDMLALPVAILRAHPAARRDLQRRVAHVVADEGQDWSPYQAALLAYAGGPAGHVTAVGDPAQCIFGGSTPRYLLEFPLAYPSVRVLALHRTYRLHAATLAVANAVAAHIDGAATAGIPAHGAGPRPILHIARSATEEEAWIAEEFTRLHATGALHDWADAAVLVRTHAQRRRLAHSLAVAGLPCRAHIPTLDRVPAVAALIAWLALLRDSADSTALVRALDATHGHQRDTTSQGLVSVLATDGPWTMERLHRACPPGLTDGQRRDLAHFIRLYDGLATLSAGREPTVIFDAVLERTGLRAWADRAGWDTTREMATLRALAMEESDVGALEQALAEEVIDDQCDAIRVSTVHAYKGQEAEVVFVAGLNEGIFPHRVCVRRRRAGMQQELRAFYVAVTRARSRLYLSASCEPATPECEGRPSRFLDLIAPGLLQAA